MAKRGRAIRGRHSRESSGESKKDLLFRLIPAAVIAGRVFDEDGEAVPNATVTASREAYHEGRRTLATTAEASTDDLGSFRLFGLAPGRYYLSATERHWGQVVGETCSSC
jgi:protocatechuate 3,4-dioxygenase beta subunit